MICKEKFRLIWVLIFLLFGIIPMLGAENKVKVISDKAEIHAEPRSDSYLMTTVEKGTVLDLFQSGKFKGNWYYVTFYSPQKRTKMSGFIHSESVVKIHETSKYGEEEKTESKKSQEEKEKKVVTKVSQTKAMAEKKKVTPEKREQVVVADEKGGSFYIKIKAGYFSPSEEFFKDIYGGGITYGGEIGLSVWRNLVLWIGGDYFYKKGKLTYTGEDTELTLVPLGGGLKYIVEAGGNLSFYGGAGLFYCKTEEKNPIDEVSEGGLGYIGKIGGYVNVFEGMFIDLYLDYSYCKMKPADYEINIGGVEGGIGIGYEF